METNPRKTRGKRHEFARWLEREKPESIGEREWDELRSLLSPVSESRLRHLLRESGLPLAPLIDGVRQDTLDTLEASLLKLLDEYEQSSRERQILVRRFEGPCAVGIARRSEAGRKTRDDLMDDSLA